MDTKTGLLGKVKLKHAWIGTLLIFGYILARQGWPSPAFETIMVGVAKIWSGMLLGLAADAVHFYLWKPSTQDLDYENRRRRAAFLLVGMLAGALVT